MIWYSSWPACKELPASPVQKLYTNSTLISRNTSILRPLTRTVTCNLHYTCIWRFFVWHGLGPSHWLLRDTGHTRSRSRRTTTTLVTVFENNKLRTAGETMKYKSVLKFASVLLTCYLLLVVDGRRSSVNFNCPILCLGDSRRCWLYLLRRRGPAVCSNVR